MGKMGGPTSFKSGTSPNLNANDIPQNTPSMSQVYIPGKGYVQSGFSTTEGAGAQQKIKTTFCTICGKVIFNPTIQKCPNCGAPIIPPQ